MKIIKVSVKCRIVVQRRIKPIKRSSRPLAAPPTTSNAAKNHRRQTLRSSSRIIEQQSQAAPASSNDQRQSRRKTRPVAATKRKRIDISEDSDGPTIRKRNAANQSRPMNGGSIMTTIRDSSSRRPSSSVQLSLATNRATETATAQSSRAALSANLLSSGRSFGSSAYSNRLRLPLVSTRPTLPTSTSSSSVTAAATSSRRPTETVRGLSSRPASSGQPSLATNRAKIPTMAQSSSADLSGNLLLPRLSLWSFPDLNRPLLPLVSTRPTLPTSTPSSSVTAAAATSRRLTETVRFQSSRPSATSQSSWAINRGQGPTSAAANSSSAAPSGHSFQRSTASSLATLPPLFATRVNATRPLQPPTSSRSATAAAVSYRNTILIDDDSDSDVEIVQRATAVSSTTANNESTSSVHNVDHTCKICKTSEIQSICLPCGHFCICHTCYNRMPKLPQAQCPICRTPIASYTKAYF